MEYWPGVVAVWTERSEVRTKRPRANIPQSSPRARLVSSLLYGTRATLACFLLKRTSGHLNSRDFRGKVFLTTLNVIGLLNCPITNCPIINCPITTSATWQVN